MGEGFQNRTVVASSSSQALLNLTIGSLVEKGPVEVHETGKQVEPSEGEVFLSNSNEELVQDSGEVEQNSDPNAPKNSLLRFDSLVEEEERLGQDRRMDSSSKVVESEVEEDENCIGSVADDGADEVVVAKSADRIAGDSEEEYVRATIVVEKKHGKSKVKAGKEAIRSKHISSKIGKGKHRAKLRNSKSLGVELLQSAAAGRFKRKTAVIEKEVAKIIETGTAIGFDFKKADKEVKEAIAIREEEDEARFVDRYGQ
ncbi:hypothetical protein Q3G72_001508 [Acer saccharum]|nr:hypothetical protein Q3G72_001508 [Acer saccharum]